MGLGVWRREFFWKFVRINCQIFWVGLWDLKILPDKAGKFEKKCLANIFFSWGGVVYEEVSSETIKLLIGYLIWDLRFINGFLGYLMRDLSLCRYLHL